MHRVKTCPVQPLTDTPDKGYGESSWRAALSTFARKQPLGIIGAAILFWVILLAFLAPVIAPFDPYEVHVLYKYAAPGTYLDETGQRFWLGADQLGRDTLSRLVYGARISLYVSLVSVSIGVTLGALIGIVSAYYGGKVDLVVQRLVDTIMAFPAIILALAVVSVFGAALRNVILFLPGGVCCRLPDRSMWKSHRGSFSFPALPSVQPYLGSIFWEMRSETRWTHD